jgi:2-alkyl-3-oxoalkanoate reductase
MALFLVSGVSGFVGKALTLRLLELGHSVIGISRQQVDSLVEKRLIHIQFDLNNDINELKEALNKVLSRHSLGGIAAIFHTAAKVDVWGRYEEFYNTNYNGTLKLLDLAKELQIERFIYTSSPSVVAGGSDLLGVDESCPYPVSYNSFYPATKSLAEKLVLSSNTDLLKTISLRPHLIFGPGDNHLIPTIIEKARSNRLKVIGDGENLTDVCFITDCVSAHLAAYQALGVNTQAAGKPFFISQGEPVRLWDWINQILEIFDLPPITKKISPFFAKGAASTAEWVSRFFYRGEKPPSLTKFLVSQMSTNHYFNISAAKRELGFHPQYSVKEAIKLTRDYYSRS